MILGHVGFGEPFHRFIHAFHMPLFYFISGYFFSPKGKTAVQYLKRKARRLILPYILFALVHLLIWIAINPNAYHRIPKIVINILLFPNADAFPIAGALWFLVSLFISEGIVLIAVKTIQNKVAADMVFCCILFFAGFITRVVPFALPFTLDSSFVGASIIYFSFRIKERWDNALDYVNNIPKWIVSILSVCLFISIMLHETINIRVVWLGATPLFWWVNAIGAIFVLWFFAKAFVKFQNMRWLRSILAKIGSGSIVYVCLNQLVILTIHSAFPHECSVLTAVLTIVILYFCDMLLNHPKLRFMIGK